MIKSRVLNLKRFNQILGASFVEFSLAAFVFVFLVLGLVDFIRYTAVQAILIRGAQEGLNLASKAEHINISPSQLSITGELSKYLTARAAVLTAATRFPLSTMISSSSSLAAVKLLSFNDLTIVGASAADAILIRPGESYQCSDGYEATHPTVLPSSYASISTQDYSTVLINHPLVVQMRADFSTVLPFFPPFKITGSAIGFREDFLRSGKGVAPAALPTITGPTTTSGGGTTSTSTTSSSTSTTTSVSSTTSTTACSTVCTYPQTLVGCTCVCDEEAGWVNDDGGGCARGRGG